MNDKIKKILAERIKEEKMDVEEAVEYIWEVAQKDLEDGK